MILFKKFRLLGASALVLLSGIFSVGASVKNDELKGCITVYSCGDETQEAEAETSSSEESRPEMLYVHVAGEVVSPGVYALSKGSRVSDAVLAAGGFTQSADPDYLNLAMVLTDGTQVYCAACGEEKTERPYQAAVSSQGGPVDLNTADAALLMTLPGIGERKALAILQYRTENGFFSCIEDLMNVSGIGQGIFDRLKDKITV